MSLSLITDAVTWSFLGDVASSAAETTAAVNVMTTLDNATLMSDAAGRRFVNCSGELYSMKRAGGDER